MGDSTVIDQEAEDVLRALLYRPGRPPRTPYFGGAPHKAGQPISASDSARARSRALSRLAKLHDAEFRRLWREAEWDIYEGRES